MIGSVVSGLSFLDVGGSGMMISSPIAIMLGSLIVSVLAASSTSIVTPKRLAIFDSVSPCLMT